MGKVSVIVPVYNAETYLKRCCDSILQQTYKNLELILINDGSVDNSGSLCDSIAKQDVRVKVIHTENQGVSVARNTGLENATGDWVMFVDADDWIESSVIEKMLQVIQKKSADLGIYGFVFEYIEQKLKLIAETLDCTVKELLKEAGQLKERDLVFCSVCNKIYRRNIISEHKLRFDKGIKFGEDFIFNTYYFMHAEKVVSEPTVFYHYDCSVENSGVKKLYQNYDEFIQKMELALRRLLETRGENSIEEKQFFQEFILERWDYVLALCVEQNISSREKIDYLQRWLPKIESEMRLLSFTKKNTISRFAKCIGENSECSRSLIARELLKIQLKKKVILFKRMIKKGFS